MERGDLDAAEDVVNRVGNWAAFRLTLNQRMLPATGRLRMAQGRWREALEAFRESGEIDRQRGISNSGRIPWAANAAIAMRALEQTEEAAALAEEELRGARQAGAARAIGVALRARALTADGDQRLELLEEAVAVLEESPSRLEQARALADLGAELRRRGEAAGARQHLHRAAEIAESGGALAIMNEALVELEASGARRRARPFTGLDSLTASERRIAALAAGGLTNNAIAQSLFVTPKTVEMHLRNSFRKLDIRRRADLPAELRESSSAGRGAGPASSQPA